MQMQVAYDNDSQNGNVILSVNLKFFLRFAGGFIFIKWMDLKLFTLFYFLCTSSQIHY